MEFLKKHYTLFTTLLGVFLGYVFLHPFLNLVNEFFHVHADESLHIHWGEISSIIFNSFKLEFFTHALAYAALAGIAGYFFGRTVSAYRKMNEQLEKFSKIGVNAAIIIHDLNNPLTGIKWSVELLRKTAKDKNQEKIYDLITKSVNRVSGMMLEIKMIAGGSADIKIFKKPADLLLMLKDIISGMGLENKVWVNSTFKEKVLIDPAYFERVLWNLIKNASEALGSKKDGKINIKINSQDGLINIAVSDNGPGISKKILVNLFTLGGTFGKRGGTGLGLYNSKRIVEAHGGKIWVKSTEGEGSTFYIQIPKK